MDSDITPTMDLDAIDGLLDIAEAAGGTLAMTDRGRLVIYGVKDATAAAARLNAPGTGLAYYVEALDATTLGIKLG